MLRTSFVAAMLATGWFAAGVGAQAPADFSGRWKVETKFETPATSATAGAATQPRGDMGSGWGTTIAITQNANQLIVESILYSNYDLQAQPRFVYALDGSETRNTMMMGRGFQEIASRARWDGSSLRITTAHTLTDPSSGKPLTMDVTQTLSLSSPTTLVVEVTRAGVLGSQPSTTRTVYTKG
jgi:hypothetical protein